ncbi:hypothetical protein [Mammaliicoccus lentus]|uniref:hypothetical protein n=1 Tax=Mammaliicoccus lentus TaxID=42858 RepID=UPI001071AC9E|nr:hypothetical protein [Mammaliicoccus lentus]MBF0793345.1 hypothetical protein [Mammaliicoccus lentus]TFV17846.1 hypothetical protein E4T78_01675 [Mammaliicoccus lentus]
MISGGLIVGLILLVALMLNLTLTSYNEAYAEKHAKNVGFIIMWLVWLNLIMMILTDWWR